LSPHLANYPDVAKETASGDLVFWATDRESLIGVGYNTNVQVSRCAAVLNRT
jgi:hypothetical protein